jgi:hypothetical protein
MAAGLKASVTLANVADGQTELSIVARWTLDTVQVRTSNDTVVQ